MYARLSPSDYAAWVAQALVQTTDSTSTRHLPPLIDHLSIVAFLPILRAHLRARREGDPRPLNPNSPPRPFVTAALRRQAPSSSHVPPPTLPLGET